MSNSGTTTYRYAIRTHMFNHNKGTYLYPPMHDLFKTKVKATAFYKKAVKIRTNRVYFVDIRKQPNYIRNKLKHMPIRYH